MTYDSAFPAVCLFSFQIIHKSKTTEAPFSMILLSIPREMYNSKVANTLAVLNQVIIFYLMTNMLLFMGATEEFYSVNKG